MCHLRISEQNTCDKCRPCASGSIWKTMLAWICIVSSCLCLAQGRDLPLERISETDSRPPCPCGHNAKPLDTRVVGGHAVGRNHFPYASNLMMRSYQREREMPLYPFCGGTLITERHIVTAGHCIKDRRPIELLADVGDYSLAVDRDRQVLNVKNVTKYPEYRIGEFHTDIALVELEHPVKFREATRMAILPTPEVDLPPGSTVTVYGWGRLGYEEGSPKELQAVDLPVVDNEECQKHFVSDIEPHMLCAGGERGKDACIGDSGSGLVARLDNDYVLVGVVSFGKNCALPHIPGVYTRVSSFFDWIMENTKSSDCKPCVYGNTLSE